MNNKNKNGFNDELNSLFEKLIERKQKGLKNIEELKKKITEKLDKEIKQLYAKKDFIKEMWENKDELRLQKVSFLKNISKNTLIMNIRYLFSMPFIYMMIIPAIILHIFLEIYHQICFRLYGIPLVKMSEYFIFDRRFLPYLNWFERFNCFYCSYFNCLIAYTREIGGCTEKYWCPIKHSKNLKDTHSKYDEFVEYSDGEALRKKWDELRNSKLKN